MGKKSEETKNALADALLAILLENERKAITVKSVSERAGVDRQTFYYHFDSMEGLIGFLTQREVSALTEELGEGVSFDELMSILVDQVAARKRVFKSLLDRFGRSTLKHLLHDRVIELFRAHAPLGFSAEAVPGGLQRRDEAVEYCALASASVLEAWIMNELDMDEGHLKCFLADSFRQQLAGIRALNAERPARTWQAW